MVQGNTCLISDKTVSFIVAVVLKSYCCCLQDDVLLSESSHFTFVYDDPEYSLVALNARPEHSGVYTCTAKNLAGSNSCKAELTVHTGLQTHFSRDRFIIVKLQKCCVSKK